MKLLLRFFGIVVSYFIYVAVAQVPARIQALDDEVYALNNALNYTGSAAKIRAFGQQHRDPESQYYAHLFMSYTHKRVFDYPKVLQELDTAAQFGAKTANPAYFEANIRYQRALALFDIREYHRADSLMRLLAASGYRHLASEAQGKMVMQEAYLAFLARHYPEAERHYQQAIALMQVSSPCDLPMIYGKEIELYFEMDQPQKMQKAFENGMKCADSCNIIKYKLYLQDILIQKKLIKTQYWDDFVRFDSLKNIYSKEENVEKLKKQANEYIVNQIKYNYEKQKLYTYTLLGISVILIFSLILLAIQYFWVKRQRNFISRQSAFNEQLFSILSHDIKEPLLGVQLLLRKLPTADPAIGSASSSLSNQLKTVNSLLNNLVGLKRAQSTSVGWPRPRVQTDVAPVVAQVAAEVAMSMQQKSVVLHTDLPASLRLPLQADQLRIVLRNLLSNAIKYSYPGGEIRLFAVPDGLALRDFGPGIPPDILAQLVSNPVEPAPGTASEAGSGMGLYLMGQLLADTRVALTFDIPEAGGGLCVYLRGKS